MDNKSVVNRILMLVKKQGQATAAEVALKLDMTKEGARQHLLKIEKQGFLKGYSRSKGVGRPLTYYNLTEKGLKKFPDSHAQITVELLRSVKNVLGENALNLLITDREQETYNRYQEEMQNAASIDDRLDKLVQLRSEEGYMAEWKKDNDSCYFLIENHCPICAAAKECQGFCRAELKNFRSLIGTDYKVDRVKHIIQDETRCVYKIVPLIS